MRLLVLLTLPVFAAQPCTDSTTTQNAIQDKTVALYDALMPFFLQDPALITQFHLTRAKHLYTLAGIVAKTNPARAARLAGRGQNHITLIEAAIKRIKNQSTVPFAAILASIADIAQLRTEVVATVPSNCSTTMPLLESFGQRTETSIKKLYYESLLR